MSSRPTDDVGPLVLRRAGAADVGAIVALVESAYRGEASRAGWTTEADLLDGQRTDAAAVAAALGAAGSEILLAERRGELVGCCQLSTHERGCYFAMFAVRPLLQRQGIGAAVLAAAEQRARERGASVLRLTVIAQRAELISWYARHGYIPTGETLAFPYGDERFGRPRRDDLCFVVCEKVLVAR